MEKVFFAYNRNRRRITHTHIRTHTHIYTHTYTHTHTYTYLCERRMDVKVEATVDVLVCKLAKMRLVPPGVQMQMMLSLGMTGTRGSSIRILVQASNNRPFPLTRVLLIRISSISHRERYPKNLMKTYDTTFGSAKECSRVANAAAVRMTNSTCLGLCFVVIVSPNSLHSCKSWLDSGVGVDVVVVDALSLVSVVFSTAAREPKRVSHSNCHTMVHTVLRVIGRDTSLFYSPHTWLDVGIFVAVVLRHSQHFASRQK
jgi:hypothetical protein